MNLNISVTTVIDYGLGDRISIHDKGMWFPVPCHLQTDSRTHTSFYLACIKSALTVCHAAGGQA
jgi:hypothetical protein